MNSKPSKIPLSSTLNENILEGYLFCLHHQGLTASEAHANLLKFTENEIYNEEEVDDLFDEIENGEFKMKQDKTLVLAENGVFKDAAVINYIDSMAKDGRCRGQVCTALTDVVGKGLYGWKFVFEHFKENEEIEWILPYEKNYLRGFIICLHIQNYSIQKAYDKLKEVTVEEAMSIQEITKLYEDIARGEYIVQEHDKKIWDALKNPIIMEKIVEQADLKTRMALYQTHDVYKAIIDNLPFHVENFNLIMMNDYLKIEVDSEIIREHSALWNNNWQSTNKGFIQKDGTIWLQHDQLLNVEAMDLFNWIVNRDNLKIKNFRLLTDKQHNILNYTKIKAENVYLNQSKYLEWFDPGTIKTIIQLFPSFDCSHMEQWRNAEAYWSHRQFLVHEAWRSMLHFKFVIYGVPYFASRDEVMELKEALLRHPELREMKLACPMKQEDFDRINIELGTFNSKDTVTPNWARYTYPPPNHDKVLSMCVAGRYVWFRGPGYIPGELEKAKEEMEVIKKMQKTMYIGCGFTRDGEIEKEEEMGKMEWLKMKIEEQIRDEGREEEEETIERIAHYLHQEF